MQHASGMNVILHDCDMGCCSRWSDRYRCSHRELTTTKQNLLHVRRNSDVGL